jgi:hypothetical protein
MKIFIFSTHLTGINVPQTLQLLGDLPKTSIIRTSGSKGLDSYIPSIDEINYEVYIPWNKFNEYDSNENPRVLSPSVTKKALDLLAPCILGELKPKYVKIDNRLIHGILGIDLETPVDLIIVNNIDGKILPTTSSALVERLASHYSIKSINLEYSSSEDLKDLLNQIS